MSFMRLFKLYTLVSIVILLSSDCRAQADEYERLLSVYDRLFDEDQKDSMLLVARQMNAWALANEGDTSLRYAISTRYIGNGFEYLDSAVYYYNQSIQTLEDQNRIKHYSYADCLQKLAGVYIDNGLYSLAEPICISAIEITKEILGIQHPEYASTLDILGGLYSDIGEETKAEFYYLQALELRKEYLGEQHPDYVASLNNIGILYSNMGDYIKAETYYLNAMKIFRATKRTASLDYADFLNNFGDFYSDFFEFDKAELYHFQALEIRKKTLGELHPDFAASLNNLGITCYRKGDYESAELYLKRALDINEKTLGEEHIDYVLGLNNLAILYDEIGELVKVEIYYRNALRIMENTVGEEHPYYADVLSGLGSLYLELRNYDKAEYYYLQALDLRSRTIGVEHPDYATILNNLGVFYADLGDYIKAERFYIDAMNIRRKTLGELHPDYAEILNNIGVLYSDMGDYGKAIEFCRNSEAIYVKTIGENNIKYATVLADLGDLYLKIGDYFEVENLYLNALSLIGNLLGTDHLAYSTMLNDLGYFYFYVGEFSKAEKIYLQSLAIREREFGHEHPDISGILMDLGILYSDKGDYTTAMEYYKRVLEICDNDRSELYSTYYAVLVNSGVVYCYLSDFKNGFRCFRKAQKIVKKSVGKDHLDYAAVLTDFGNLYLDFGNFHKANDYFLEALMIKRNSLGELHPEIAGVIQNLATVNAKLGQMLVADSFAHELAVLSKLTLTKQFTLRSSLQESYKSKYFEIHEFIANYALWRGKGITTLGLASFNNWLYLNGLLNERDALLKREIDTSGDSTLKPLFDSLYHSRLQLSKYYELSKDEQTMLDTAISMAEEEYERVESCLVSRLESINRVGAIYDFVDLQNQLSLDESYVDILRLPYYDFDRHAWTDSTFYLAFILPNVTVSAPILVNLGDGKQIDEILYPYLVGQTTNPTSTTMDGLVYDLLWKPLEEHLAGKTKIYLSPGGIYHSINPETIYHAETGKYLFEEKEIHLATSGRSFVDQRIYGNRDYTDKTALIMGAPNFDYSYVADSTLLGDNVSFTNQTMRDLSLDGNRRAAPLPATRSEVEGINQTFTSSAWNAQLLTGNDAMESNLKQMDSPRILHIATHGYFMEDVKPENDNGMRTMGMDAQRVAENPMLRSGLLLAGCNKTLADNTPLTGGDNGILTAYEAGLLDLSKTELVVLSACETGKGEILNGEGVQGLRKAMTDAGAEHILMSLWKVDDKVTSEYMQTFYDHYAQGKSIRESYNLTRNEIKQKYPQPYYWGAFVLVGE